MEWKICQRKASGRMRLYPFESMMVTIYGTLVGPIPLSMVPKYYIPKISIVGILVADPMPRF